MFVSRAYRHFIFLFALIALISCTERSPDNPSTAASGPNHHVPDSPARSVIQSAISHSTCGDGVVDGTCAGTGEPCTCGADGTCGNGDDDLSNCTGGSPSCTTTEECDWGLWSENGAPTEDIVTGLCDATSPYDFNLCNTNADCSGSCDTVMENPMDMVVDGDYAYMVDDGHGLWVLDLSAYHSSLDPTDIKVNCTYLPSGSYNANAIQKLGDYLYVSFGHTGVSLFDIATLQSITTTGSSLSSCSSAEIDSQDTVFSSDIAVYNDILYVADSGNGLKRYQIAYSSGVPYISTACNEYTTYAAFSVEVLSNKAFISTGMAPTSYIVELDASVSCGSNLTYINDDSLSGYPGRLYKYGSYVYITNADTSTSADTFLAYSTSSCTASSCGPALTYSMSPQNSAIGEPQVVSLGSEISYSGRTKLLIPTVGYVSGFFNDSGWGGLEAVNPYNFSSGYYGGYQSTVDSGNPVIWTVRHDGDRLIELLNGNYGGTSGLAFLDITALGNSDLDPDACRRDCAAPHCGDGITDAGEDCDRGTSDTASCNYDGGTGTYACTARVCGDGYVNSAVEDCDTTSDTSTCNYDGGAGLAACTYSTCGDGYANAADSETCDDGDTGSCAGPCNSTCTGLYTHTCGNSTTECGEACDDGNTTDCDGCSADCTVSETGCGDGVICGSEVCDDGDTDNRTAGCNTDCTGAPAATCGNGVVEFPETCDSGSDNGTTTSSADYCNMACSDFCEEEPSGAGQHIQDSWAWIQTMGGTNDYNGAVDVVMDSEGNSYVVGKFGRFDNIFPGCDFDDFNSGYSAGFVAKINMRGVCQWLVHVPEGGGNNGVMGVDILEGSTTADDVIYITGYIHGSASFEPTVTGVGPFSYSCPNTSSMWCSFLARLDYSDTSNPDLEPPKFAWAKLAGNGGASGETGVVVRSTNPTTEDVVVLFSGAFLDPYTGVESAATTPDCLAVGSSSPASSLIPCKNGVGGYTLAKFDKHGERYWAIPLYISIRNTTLATQGVSWPTSNGMEMDQLGQIYVAGYYGGSNGAIGCSATQTVSTLPGYCSGGECGSGSGPCHLPPSTGNIEGVLAKISSSGTVDWVIHTTNDASAKAFNVAVDPNNTATITDDNIYVVGLADGTANLKWNGTSCSLNSTDEWYVAQFDYDGDLLECAGDTGIVSDLALQLDGDALITGWDDYATSMWLSRWAPGSSVNTLLTANRARAWAIDIEPKFNHVSIAGDTYKHLTIHTTFGDIDLEDDGYFNSINRRLGATLGGYLAHVATDSMICDSNYAQALPNCGDGTVQTVVGEQCDASGESSTCDDDCTYVVCGDGNLNSSAGESCDDGFTTACGACNANCSGAGSGSCGDGTVCSDNEECDEGGSNSDTTADACRTDCTLAHCGDGVIDDGEDCDDGASNSDTTADACRTNCMDPFCGDGTTDTGETCDDGMANGLGSGYCKNDCSGTQ